MSDKTKHDSLLNDTKTQIYKVKERDKLFKNLNKDHLLLSSFSNSIANTLYLETKTLKIKILKTIIALFTPAIHKQIKHVLICLVLISQRF